jgi:hypothetical protein
MAVSADGSEIEEDLDLDENSPASPPEVAARMADIEDLPPPGNLENPYQSHYRYRQKGTTHEICYDKEGWQCFKFCEDCEGTYHR